MKPFGHDQRELTHVARPHEWWVMPLLELPGGRGPISYRVGEAAELAVAQPVEDQGEEVSGGGDAADVATSAGSDTGFDRGDLGVAYGAGDRFDSGPAQQARALFGDPATGDVTVGLAVAWGQPGP